MTENPYQSPSVAEPGESSSSRPRSLPLVLEYSNSLEDVAWAAVVGFSWFRDILFVELAANLWAVIPRHSLLPSGTSAEDLVEILKAKGIRESVDELPPPARWVAIGLMLVAALVSAACLLFVVGAAVFVSRPIPLVAFGGCVVIFGIMTILSAWMLVRLLRKP